MIPERATNMLWLLALFLLQTGCTVHEPNFSSVNSMCGPQSLFYICQQNKIPATLEELCELSEYRKTAGTTLYGLYQAAYKKGLSPKAVRIDIDTLCGLTRACIVFVNNNHFMVYLGSRDNTIMVLNPPGTPEQLTRSEFQDIWNGETLVFSGGTSSSEADTTGNRAPMTAGPAIQFARNDHYFGVVDEGNDFVHSFPFRNSGTDTLKILAIQTRCTCLEAMPFKKSISPGDSGVIIIKLNTRDKPKGLTTQRAIVRTNDRSNPYSILVLEAIVRKQARAIPDRIYLGEVDHGETEYRTVMLEDTGYGAMSIDQITAPEGIRAEILPALEDTLGNRSIPVKLSIKAAWNPGAFEKRLVIHTNVGKHPNIAIPITGIIRSPVTAFPPRVFFGEVRQKTRTTKEITLTPAGAGSTIEISRIVTPNNTSAEMKKSGTGNSVVLRVILDAPAYQTTISDSIRVFSAKSKTPIAMIPLFARIGTP